MFAFTVVLALVLPCYGQSQEDHAKHHPKGDGVAMPPAGKNAGTAESAAKDGGGMEGMMDGMMKKMGVPPPKDLYPSLMSLPKLTTEQREQVRSLAVERMRSAVALMSAGLDKLAAATEIEDYAAMQDATGQVREAVARFESGLAARRVLAEGKPPRQVAKQWFKDEMSLQPPQGVEARSSRSGTSLFHLFTMILLVAFALAMVAMYFAKMRRAAALFGRIEADKGSPPPGSAPPLAGTLASDTKTAPAAPDVKAEPLAAETKVPQT